MVCSLIRGCQHELMLHHLAAAHPSTSAPLMERLCSLQVKGVFDTEASQADLDRIAEQVERRCIVAATLKATGGCWSLLLSPPPRTARAITPNRGPSSGHSLQLRAVVQQQPGSTVAVPALCRHVNGPAAYKGHGLKGVRAPV
jgi:hypothetical protein